MSELDDRKRDIPRRQNGVTMFSLVLLDLQMICRHLLKSLSPTEIVNFFV